MLNLDSWKRAHESRLYRLLADTESRGQSAPNPTPEVPGVGKSMSLVFSGCFPFDSFEFAPPPSSSREFPPNSSAAKPVLCATFESKALPFSDGCAFPAFSPEGGTESLGFRAEQTRPSGIHPFATFGRCRPHSSRRRRHCRRHRRAVDVAAVQVAHLMERASIFASWQTQTTCP